MQNKRKTHFKKVSWKERTFLLSKLYPPNGYYPNESCCNFLVFKIGYYSFRNIWLCNQNTKKPNSYIINKWNVRFCMFFFYLINFQTTNKDMNLNLNFFYLLFIWEYFQKCKDQGVKTLFFVLCNHKCDDWMAKKGLCIFCSCWLYSASRRWNSHILRMLW